MRSAPPQAFYTGRINDLTGQYRHRKQRYDRIATLRLAVAIAAGIAIYLQWGGNWTYPLLTAAIALAIFLWLVNLSTSLKQELDNLQVLIAINKEELEILSGHYTQRYDGASLAPPHHAYAHDLDLFGKASLFQYLHRTTSEQAHQLLAGWLLNPATHAAIEQRQRTAQSLRAHTAWRQQLQAQGFQHPLTMAAQTSLANWLAQPLHFSRQPVWRSVRFILPAISLSLLALHIAGIAGAGIFYSMVFVFLAASGYVSKLVTPQYLQLSKHIEQMETLAESLQCVEQCPVPLANDNGSPLLPGRTEARSNNTPSAEVRQLKRILDRMDYRLNPPVFILLNTFLFWDLQQVLQLEKWKARHKDSIAHWFHSIATAEALCSLANASFNHPAWCFPAIRADWFELNCVDGGHPLIMPAKSVTNSFHMSGHPQLAFITGSNMAGKSTFLRTIGANLVLAMAGAPVCAAQFETPTVSVMTSMRIADNLEESASTFYAELQKLKRILDAVKAQSKKGETAAAAPRVFLLLDEILRGTNSLDRHTGSEALIRQLIREDAAGIIASHDVTLADLQAQYPEAITNYHFDVTIAGNELSFDYKLKTGVCQTLNATLLMRKIGIDL